MVSPSRQAPPMLWLLDSRVSGLQRLCRSVSIHLITRASRSYKRSHGAGAAG
jgi:hypothetical protein